MKLQNVLPRLAEGSAEQRAIDAGEIDAVVDYEGSNIILLPAARRALREAASRASAASRGASGDASIANCLLAALPQAEYRGLLAGLEPLTLKFGEVLHEPGAPIRYVHFPVDCVISLLAAIGDRRSLEVGLVGYEGMVGISLILGAGISSIRALVQATGTAMRMKAERLRDAFQQCPALRQELYRYANEKLAQARQTAACHRFHSIEARLARWLLMTADRARSEEFFLTQAFLADMLAVRRATVNEAAGPLQERRLISYCRGRIRILDRKGLEAAACGCYARIGTSSSLSEASRRGR